MDESKFSSEEKLGDAKQATPRDVLMAKLLDSRVPKTELEWFAKREIERLLDCSKAGCHMNCPTFDKLVRDNRLMEQGKPPLELGLLQEHLEDARRMLLYFFVKEGIVRRMGVKDNG